MNTQMKSWVITGTEAIRIAERDGVTLRKYAAPVEGYQDSDRHHHVELGRGGGINSTTETETSMYLIKVGDVYHAYPSTVGDREVAPETARSLWAGAYPEYATSIEVLPAPPADAAGNPFSLAWGRSYRKTGRGYEVHSTGRA